MMHITTLLYEQCYTASDRHINLQSLYFVYTHTSWQRARVWTCVHAIKSPLTTNGAAGESQLQPGTDGKPFDSAPGSSRKAATTGSNSSTAQKRSSVAAGGKRKLLKRL
jgi:hypothetical protein